MKDFYKGKKVLITGHTGFKGTWLCRILRYFDAQVIGYALEPPTNPSLFQLTNIDKEITSYIGDIRDLAHLKKIFEWEQPDIVIHMAAQPIVRVSYEDPVGTYETNVMGTVNVLESVRQTPSVRSVINVTTDKVYMNNEWDRGYVETDVLNGYDPYSSSKSCSELVTNGYIQSFLHSRGIAVSTCRAGNVIGGGDFAKDRIIPDCIRAAERNNEIIIRNPYSTRPYQHVLEPLFVYLMLAMAQWEQPELAGCYNVGPEDKSCVSTGTLVSMFCERWNMNDEEYKLTWLNKSDGGPHEAGFLKLNCSKLKNALNWKPRWTIAEALLKVVEFEQLRGLSYATDVERSEALNQCMQSQIEEFIVQ